MKTRILQAFALMALVCTALAGQLAHAAPYSQIVDLGVLGEGLIALEGKTPKKDFYLFSLAADGKIAVNVATVDFHQNIHKASLWDITGGDILLGKGEDIGLLNLLAGNAYRIEVSGGNRYYGGSLGVVTGVSEIPLPASAWLFGSALLGLSLGKKRLAKS